MQSLRAKHCTEPHLFSFGAFLEMQALNQKLSASSKLYIYCQNCPLETDYHLILPPKKRHVLHLSRVRSQARISRELRTH